MQNHEKKTFVSALLLASGSGLRFQDDLPKQFHYLSGKKIYLHTLEAFINIPSIEEIILVCPSCFLKQVEEEISSYTHKKIKIISGGRTRQESSYLGLLACNPLCTHIVIHDAVRPFVSKEIIEENISLCISYGACDTCIPSFDTIVHSKDKENIHDIPLRSEYYRGQTPQSFSYPLLKESHEKALEKGILDATDDCRLVLLNNHPIKLAKGSEENIKITTYLDLCYAEQILRFKASLIPFDISSETLENKIFVVTGSTGGIGKEITLLLKSKKATVIELSRTSSFSVDLTKEEETKVAFETISKTYGAIDGLINCIGYLKVENVDDLVSSEIDKLIASNFTSFVYSCKYCKIKDFGHIINLSSSSYIRGRKSYAIYSSMKAAVVNFTQALSLERPSLYINSLIPKRTDTPMRRENFPSEPHADLLSPKKVAECVLQTLLCKTLTGMAIEIKR